MPQPDRTYATPNAARRAVTDRLKQLSKASDWSLGELQRQYAYDQFIERLYRVDGGWVIKGATALLARRVSVRHTIDIDLYRAGPIADAERHARTASALDIGDWMSFDLGASTTIVANGAEGRRITVTSLIGAKPWANFRIDLVAAGILMVGLPEDVEPLLGLGLAGRPTANWRAYPLVDHVADKVCAIFERHNGMPSTRYKDLIDLLAISRNAVLDAELQLEALREEAQRRGLTLPAAFEVPAPELWEPGYRAEARRTSGLDITNLQTAVATIRPFLNPLLNTSATGVWDPLAATWHE